MSLTTFCQITSKEQGKIKVSKGALILIKKDLQFCDSLKVAYAFKSKELRRLQQKNINLFSQLQKENSKTILLQNQIESQQKQIAKMGKKKNNTLLWFGGGVLVGIITGVLIK